MGIYFIVSIRLLFNSFGYPEAVLVLIYVLVVGWFRSFITPW